MVLGRGHTGREIEASHDYDLARSWASAQYRFISRWHDGASEFRNLLSGVQALSGETLEVWRGRPDGERQIRSWTEMGPPPAAMAKSQRYSRAGHPVLYLCDCPVGVRSELYLHASSAIAIQRFSLSLDRLRVADLASPTIDNYLRSVFDFAEVRDPSSIGLNGFLFSQTLASLVSEAGFSGMLVPGVRGEPGKRYRNIVVFDCAAWQAFLVVNGG
jgi:hypothetical protein